MTKAQRVRRVHRGHYLELANDAEPHFHTKDEDWWLERLDVHLDNLTAAIDNSLSDDEPTTGLQLATVLPVYWELRGQYTYAAERIARLLTGPAPISHPSCIVRRSSPSPAFTRARRIPSGARAQQRRGLACATA